MKKRIALVVAIAGCVLAAALWSGRKASASSDMVNLPVYTSDGKLALPANYRDWVFLTSGFGMNYANGNGNNPMFTNVYVTPEAYKGFKASGKWPDKSMFIVEIYSPASHGSINKDGHYQDTYHGLDVEVKDSSRPKEWSYYAFSPGETAGEPEAAGCNKCHSEHAAVENTFVQFYPTLLDFALEKGLVKSSVSIPLNESRFLKLLGASGWEKAEQAYDQDRKKNPDADLLSESSLNRIGYSLLREKKTSDAISVFKLATRDYPNSVNAYDSLGDAYAAAGQTDAALAASQKELALAQSDSSLSPDRKKQFTELAQKRIAAMGKH
jgi:tetratricopeptide (TPR) repeat protein